MNIALWIVASLLAVGCLGGGLTMLALSKPRFRALGAGQRYVDEFSPGFIKAIGAVTVLAAAGLTLPAMLDITPVLVPMAALGIVLLMTGATTVRIVRREWRFAVVDLVFFAMAGFVAWGRFAAESFGG